MDKGKKHEFLSHPIKDMIKNWNIDIANVLEDYMEEIEKMTFSFDGGKTNLNFAEASYLIQGTACVWGKKVEHLHNLVYKALDMINKNQHETDEDAANNQQETNSNQTMQDEQDEKYMQFQISTPKIRKMVACEEILPTLPKPTQAIDQSDLDSCETALLNANDDVVAYKDDMKCVSSTKLANGMARFAKKFKGIQLSFGDPGPISTPEVDIPSSDDKGRSECGDLMDIFNEDPAPPSVVDDNDDGADELMNAEEFDDIITEVEEQVQKRQLRQRLEPVSTIIEEEAPQKVLCNPHEICRSWTSKPQAKGKPFKIPASCNQNPRKRKKQSPEKPVPIYTEFFQRIKSQHSTKKLVTIEKKRRAQLWKEIKNAHMVNKNAYVDSPDAPHEDGLLEENENFDPMVDDMDENAPDFDDLIDDVKENMDEVPPARNEQEPVSLQDVTTYEDLVRHHIETFFCSAKRFIEETSLSQRVKQWEHAITPYLIEQEERPEFDIHRYGDEMISSFESVGDEILFTDAVKSEDRWSICRKFAATLQLANDNNFHLETDGEMSLNSLKLKLVSKQRSRDRFNNYTHITD